VAQDRGKFPAVVNTMMNCSTKSGPPVLGLCEGGGGCFVVVNVTAMLHEQETLLRLRTWYCYQHGLTALRLGKAIPRLALRVQGGSGSQVSRKSTHEDCKVVSITHRPPLPFRKLPGTHFC
jgi:hypothetical protein